MNFRQDMPASGGYGPIQIARKLPKQLSGYTCFGIFMGMITVGFSHYYYQRPKRRLRKLEEYDSRIALEPLINAERDRTHLKELRRNRDEEAEIMKNVEGWEVGKWKGEPVYWNLADRFPVVHPEHYYLHAKRSDMERRVYEKIYH